MIRTKNFCASPYGVTNIIGPISSCRRGNLRSASGDHCIVLKAKLKRLGFYQDEGNMACIQFMTELRLSINNLPGLFPIVVVTLTRLQLTAM